MNVKTLKVIAQLRELNQLNLAKLAGISRQAISLWFKKAESNPSINIQSKHLQKLAFGLGVSQDELTDSLPILQSESSRKMFETDLLWDRLYPNLVSFVVALLHDEKPAMARLVQVYGLFQAEKIIGNKIWKEFYQYKKYIQPVRRKNLENLWQMQKSLNLI